MIAGFLFRLSHRLAIAAKHRLGRQEREMRYLLRRIGKNRCLAGAVVLTAIGGGSSASADEAEAKALLKAMSDYMTKQTAIAFDYDTNLEVVTKEEQKIALASSGTVTINRPDKIRVTRQGGFANVEM